MGAFVHSQVILFALRPASTQLAVAAKFEASLVDLLQERFDCREPGIDDANDTLELAVLEKCLQSVVNRVSAVPPRLARTTLLSFCWLIMLTTIETMIMCGLCTVSVSREVLLLPARGS